MVIAQRARQGQPVESQFERFGFLINADLSRQNLTICNIARSMELSIRRLQRLLAAHQTSFRRCLHQKRQRLAQHIIATTTHQIRLSAANYRCGFSDPTYFSLAYGRQWNVAYSNG